MGILNKTGNKTWFDSEFLILMSHHPAPFLFSQSWNQFSFFSSELMGRQVEVDGDQNVWRYVHERTVDQRGSFSLDDEK